MQPPEPPPELWDQGGISLGHCNPTLPPNLSEWLLRASRDVKLTFGNSLKIKILNAQYKTEVREYCIPCACKWKESSISSVLCAPSLSLVPLLATPWTVALQAPLSEGCSRQEYWSGLPFPPPGDLPYQKRQRPQQGDGRRLFAKTLEEHFPIQMTWPMRDKGSGWAGCVNVGSRRVCVCVCVCVCVQVLGPGCPSHLKAAILPTADPPSDKFKNHKALLTHFS